MQIDALIEESAYWVTLRRRELRLWRESHGRRMRIPKSFIILLPMIFGNFQHSSQNTSEDKLIFTKDYEKIFLVFVGVYSLNSCMY